MSDMLTMGPMVWTRQPQFPARHNQTDLTRGLVLLWNGATPSFAPIAGIPTTISGGPSLRPLVNTVSPDFNGTTVDYRWNRAVTGTNPSEATLFALCSTDSSGEQTIVGQSRSSSNNPLFRIKTSGTTTWQAQFRGDGATTATLTDSAPITNNRLYFIVGVFRSGTGQKELWVDGRRVTTGTTDIGTITLDQTEIGVVVRAGAVQWWDGVIPLAGIYNRALSSDEITSLSKNPWQLFQPISRRIFVASAASGNISITPSNGALTLVGYAPSVASPTTITPSVSALTIAGYAPALAQGFVLTPAAAALSMSGLSPGLLQGTVLVPGVGALTVSGIAPGLVSGTVLTPGVGSLTLAGYAPTISSAGAVTPEVGTLTLTGYQPGVTQQVFIVPGVGALTVTGLAPSVAGAGTLIPSEANLTLVGYQPTVTQQIFIVPGVGEISVQGYQPLVEQQIYRIPGVGAATFLGYAPAVTQGTVITPSVGSILTAGQAPTVGTDSGSQIITPSVGSLGFIGYAPTSLTAIFIDGNGRIFYLPAQAVEWILSGRSKRWILR